MASSSFVSCDFFSARSCQQLQQTAKPKFCACWFDFSCSAGCHRGASGSGSSSKLASYACIRSKISLLHFWIRGPARVSSLFPEKSCLWSALRPKVAAPIFLASVKRPLGQELGRPDQHSSISFYRAVPTFQYSFSPIYHEGVHIGYPFSKCLLLGFVFLDLLSTALPLELVANLALSYFN